MNPAKPTTVLVEGHQVSLTNLDKPLFADGTTKAELIRYHSAIAPLWLPHLAGRALTMRRFPEGAGGAGFFEKRRPTHAPDFVNSVDVWLSEGSGRWGEQKPSAPTTNSKPTPFVTVDSTATLVWLANMAAIELHLPLAVAAAPQTPTMAVFDLDPGPGTDIVECCRVALDIRALLAHFDMEAVVKTSGSKGIQIYVPLNHPDVSWETVLDFTKAVAMLMEKEQPHKVVSRQAKNLRTGKVLIDWLQNERFRTTIGVYSVRARERPWVSTPLTWEEVSAVAEGKAEKDSLRFLPHAVLARVENHGDLFDPALRLTQSLPTLD